MRQHRYLCKHFFQTNSAFQVVILLILVILSSGNLLSQQKMQFGVTLEGSIGTFSNANKTAQSLYQEIKPPNHPDLAQKWGVWNSHELSLDIHLPNRKLQISAGLRFFDWRYIRDSVQGVQYHLDENTFEVIESASYYRAKRTITTGLPFVTIGYHHGKSKLIRYYHSFSFGYYGLIGRVYEKTAGYKDEFEVNRNKRFNNFYFSNDVSVINLKLTSGIGLLLKDGIEFKFGGSYYYLKNELSQHHGLYLSGAISLHFVK